MALLALASPARAMNECRAESGATAPRIVELYTSEGCSSCPPADAWLATLPADGGLIALGFHVTYWDRLGWPDRFADAAYTRRQHEVASREGLTYVYTPQVVVDGRDWRAWPKLPSASKASPPGSPPALPKIRLQRDGQHVVAEVTAPDRAHAARSAAGDVDAALRLAGYWAVVEDRHVSRVRAGENAGATLKHNHVVRAYQPVPPWVAAPGLKSRLAVTPGVAEHPRRVVFVVTEPDGAQRPLQALALAC